MGYPPFHGVSWILFRVSKAGSSPKCGEKSQFSGQNGSLRSRKDSKWCISMFQRIERLGSQSPVRLLFRGIRCLGRPPLGAILLLCFILRERACVAPSTELCPSAFPRVVLSWEVSSLCTSDLGLRVGAGTKPRHQRFPQTFLRSSWSHSHCAVLCCFQVQPYWEDH